MIKYDGFLHRYEPNTEKKKTHNRRKSSTRSLHQKLVVKMILAKNRLSSLLSKIALTISRNISQKKQSSDFLQFLKPNNYVGEHKH